MVDLPSTNSGNPGRAQERRPRGRASNENCLRVPWFSTDLDKGIASLFSPLIYSLLSRRPPCPLTCGYSHTNTSRVIQDPMKHLLSSRGLLHASSPSCGSMDGGFQSSPSSFLTVQIS